MVTILDLLKWMIRVLSDRLSFSTYFKKTTWKSETQNTSLPYKFSLHQGHSSAVWVSQTKTIVLQKLAIGVGNNTTRLSMNRLMRAILFRYCMTIIYTLAPTSPSRVKVNRLTRFFRSSRTHGWHQKFMTSEPAAATNSKNSTILQPVSLLGRLGVNWRTISLIRVTTFKFDGNSQQ